MKTTTHTEGVKMPEEISYSALTGAVRRVDTMHEICKVRNPECIEDGLIACELVRRWNAEPELRMMLQRIQVQSSFEAEDSADMLRKSLRDINGWATYTLAKGVTP